MKKTYSTPLVTASDVVRATETGHVTALVEISTFTSKR
jgi:hypothetical protein